MDIKPETSMDRFGQVEAYLIGNRSVYALFGVGDEKKQTLITGELAGEEPFPPQLIAISPSSEYLYIYDTTSIHTLNLDYTTNIDSG